MIIVSVNDIKDSLARDVETETCNPVDELKTIRIRLRLRITRLSSIEGEQR